MKKRKTFKQAIATALAIALTATGLPNFGFGSVGKPVTVLADEASASQTVGEHDDLYGAQLAYLRSVYGSETRSVDGAGESDSPISSYEMIGNSTESATIQYKTEQIIISGNNVDDYAFYYTDGDISYWKLISDSGDIYITNGDETPVITGLDQNDQLLVIKKDLLNPLAKNAGTVANGSGTDIYLIENEPPLPSSTPPETVSGEVVVVSDGSVSAALTSTMESYLFCVSKETALEDVDDQYKKVEGKTYDFTEPDEESGKQYLELADADEGDYYGYVFMDQTGDIAVGNRTVDVTSEEEFLWAVTSAAVETINVNGNMTLDGAYSGTADIVVTENAVVTLTSGSSLETSGMITIGTPFESSDDEYEIIYQNSSEESVEYNSEEVSIVKSVQKPLTYGAKLVGVNSGYVEDAFVDDVDDGYTLISSSTQLLAYEGENVTYEDDVVTAAGLTCIKEPDSEDNQYQYVYKGEADAITLYELKYENTNFATSGAIKNDTGHALKYVLFTDVTNSGEVVKTFKTGANQSGIQVVADTGEQYSFTGTGEYEGTDCFEKFDIEDRLCINDEEIRQFFWDLFDEEYEYFYYFTEDGVTGNLTEYVAPPAPVVGFYNVKEETPDSQQFNLLYDSNDVNIAKLTSGNAYYGEAVEAAVEFLDEEGDVYTTTEDAAEALGITDISISYSYAKVGKVGLNGRDNETDDEDTVGTISEYYNEFAKLRDRYDIDLTNLYNTKFSVQATINYKVNNNQMNVVLNTFFNYVPKDIDHDDIEVTGNDSVIFDAVYKTPDIVLKETKETNEFGIVSGESIADKFQGVDVDYKLLGRYAAEFDDETGELLTGSSLDAMIDAGDYIYRFEGLGPNYQGISDIWWTIERAEYPEMEINTVKDKVYGTPYTAEDFSYALSGGSIKETDARKTKVTYTIYKGVSADGAFTPTEYLGEFVTGNGVEINEDELAEQLARIKNVGTYQVIVEVENKNYVRTTTGEAVDENDQPYEYESSEDFITDTTYFEITRKPVEVNITDVITGTYSQATPAAFDIELEGIVSDGSVYTDTEVEDTIKDLLRERLAVNYGTEDEPAYHQMNSDVFEEEMNVGTYPVIWNDTENVTTQVADEGYFIIVGLEEEPEWANNYQFSSAIGSIEPSEDGKTESAERILTVVPAQIEDDWISFDGNNSTALTLAIDNSLEKYSVYVDGVCIYDTDSDDVAEMNGFGYDAEEKQLTAEYDGEYRIVVKAGGNYTGFVSCKWSTLQEDDADYQLSFNEDRIDDESDFIITYDGKPLSSHITVVACDSEEEEYVSLDKFDDSIGQTWTWYKVDDNIDEFKRVNSAVTKNVGTYMVVVEIKRDGYEPRQITGTCEVVPAMIDVTISDVNVAYGDANEDGVAYEYKALPDEGTLNEGNWEVSPNLVANALKNVKFKFATEAAVYTEDIPVQVGTYTISAEAAKVTNSNFVINFVNDEAPQYVVGKKDIASSDIAYEVSGKEVNTSNPLSGWAVGTISGSAVEDGLDYTGEFILEDELVVSYAGVELTDDDYEVNWIKKSIDRFQTHDYISFYLTAKEDSVNFEGRTPVIIVNFNIDQKKIEEGIVAKIKDDLNLEIAEAADYSNASKVKFTATRNDELTMEGLTVKTFGVKVLYNGKTVSGTSIEAVTAEDTIKEIFEAGHSNGVANSKNPATVTTYNVTASGKTGTWGVAYAVVEYKGETYTVYSSPELLVARESGEEQQGSMLQVETIPVINSAGVMGITIKVMRDFTSDYTMIKSGFLASNNGTITNATAAKSALILENVSNLSLTDKNETSDVNFATFASGVKDLGDGVWTVGYAKVRTSTGAEKVIYTEPVYTLGAGLQMSLSSVTNSSGVKGVTVRCMRDVSDVFTVVEAGFVASNDGSINGLDDANAQLLLDKVDENSLVKKVSNETENFVTYASGVRDNGYGVYARAYVTITNGTKTITIYSDAQYLKAE